ncbi:MAG: type IV secretion system DNA-binding domain-containing protein [Candidatus Komeilibacteria bacterium]
MILWQIIIVNDQPLFTTAVTVGLAFIVAVVVGIFILRAVIIRLHLRDQSLRVFLLTVPRFTSDSTENDKHEQQIKEQLGHIEALFASLGSLRAQRGLPAWFFGRNDQFSLEIIARLGEISFYAAVPPNMVDFFNHILQSVHPYIHVEEVTDYNIFQPQGQVTGTYVVLSRDPMFPIKTFQLFEFDPLETLTNAMSKLQVGESLALQYIVRSAKGSWHKRGVKVARALNEGKGLKQAKKKANKDWLLPSAGSMVSGIFSTLSSSSSKKPNSVEPERPQQASQQDLAIAKALEEKSTKAGMDVNIRVISFATNKITAESNLKSLVNTFGQFNIYETGNSFKAKQISHRDRLVRDFIFRRFSERASLLLNAEELVGLWHLPTPSMETPNIRWLEARQAAPPRDLPTRGLFLGESDFRSQRTPIYIKEADRRRHMYIIGQTGTGKSVLMSNLIIQDIKEGKGCCIIDPHGDLVDVILGHVPDNRVEDVIVFDPGDTARPLGLNMLEFFNPEQKTLVINEVINIFDKLYDLRKTGGPMFEQYLRNTILLMMEDVESGSSLMEVSKVLADEEFRRYKLSKSTNAVIRDFWLKEAHKAGGEAALANMVPYITSKLTQFVANDIMRPIVAQQHSSFNFRDVMDERKILLVNLSKGKIGEMNSNLLGLIVVGKLLIAALSRVDEAEDKRLDFYLYIDEFQNFLTDSISVILSEARKYRLDLTVAHQYINQLVKDGDTKIRDAVFGNVGTKIVFRVGAEDAEFLEKQFAPVFTQYDLINIPKLQAYIKLLVDNQNPPAFNFRPAPPQSGDKNRATMIRELSRMKYGRPKEQIELELQARSQRVVKPESPVQPK